MTKIATRFSRFGLAAWLGFAALPAFAVGLDDLPAGHWYEVPNSRMADLDPCPARNCSYSGTTGQDSVMRSWGGGAYDTTRDRLIVWGGGHSNYAGNEIYVFDVDSEAWIRLTQPSTSIQDSVSHYSDGKPSARHTYGDLQYDPNNDWLVSLNAGSTYGNTGGAFRTVDVFDFSTGQWLRKANRPGGGGVFGNWSAFDPDTGRFWHHGANGGGRLQAWDPSSNQWTSHTNRGGVPIYMTGDVDPTRNQLTAVGASDMYVYDLDNPDASPLEGVSSGDKAPESVAAPGFQYDPVSDRYVAWTGGTDVYLLDPQTWVWTRHPDAPGNSVSPGAPTDHGTYGRFRYMPSKNAFIVVNSASDNVFYYKLTDGGGLPDGPGLSFGASPATVSTGGDTTLTWTSSNADSCVAAGDWSGNKPTSGSASFSNLQSDRTYTLSCSNAEGTTVRTVTVDVVDTSGAYSLVVSAQENRSGAVALDGNVINGSVWIYLSPETDVDQVRYYLDDPDVSGNPVQTESSPPYDFGGSAVRYDTSQLNDGAHLITALVTLDNGGTELVTADFDVDNGGAPQTPTLSFSASPVSVQPGGSATLSWNATNATGCTASGGWSGNRGTAGTTSTGSLQSTTGFTLNCSGAGGNVQKTATVTVSTGSDDADTDWLARATAPGVLMASRFDTASEVEDWVLQNSTADNVVWDTGLKTSGNGSMRLDILKTDSTSSGNWRRYLADDQRQFGPGEEFYVQFRQYIPAYLIEHRFKGGSFSGGYAQGFKSSIISHFPNSNTPFEVVIQNSGMLGYVQGYWQDGQSTAVKWDSLVSTACTGSDFRHQPAIDHGPQFVGTPCENDRARYGGLYSYLATEGGTRGDPDPFTGAFVYEKDAWITLLQHVKVSPSGYGATSNTVETWAARDGEDYQLLVSKNNVKFGTGGKFDTLWLLNYRSNGSSDSSRQDTFTNYDEVIVSLDFIPAPGVTAGSGGVPVLSLSAASNTVAPGGTTTLSWSAANANTCLASGGWTGARPTSGSATVGPINAETTFVLTCSGDGGSVSRTVSVGVSGGDTGVYDIVYNSTGHTNGVALDGATIGGSQWIYITPEENISEVHFFLDDPDGAGEPFRIETIDPYDFGGSAVPYNTAQLSDGSHTISARVFYSGSGADLVTAQFDVDNGQVAELPVVNLLAAPASVAYEGSATLIWNSQFADSCVASGDWTGGRNVSGSESIGPLTQNSVFFLSCTGDGGTTSQSVTVLVAAPAAPSISLSAVPASVDYEGFSTVIWSTTDVDTCTASGDWSGAKAVSGSQTFGPLTQNAQFTLQCSGPGGNVSDTVQVAVAPPPAPTLSFTAAPAVVPFEGAATLTWTGTDVDSCLAVGDWGGARSTSGSETVGPLIEDASFTLICSGNGASITRSAEVQVTPPAATATLSATPQSIESGETTTLNWSSQFADTCTASGAWSGGQPTSGSQVVGPLTDDAVFDLTCQGAGGSGSATVTVTVAAAGAPTVNLTAAPPVVVTGQTSELTWSSTNTDTCLASGDWSGVRSVTGNETVGPLDTNSSYTLTCTGAGGQAARTVDVTVTQPLPVVALNAEPATVDFQGSTTLTWSATDADTCSAFGSWSGSRPASGSEVIGPLEDDAIFRLTCTGEGGSDTELVSVSVGVPTAVSVSMSIDPVSMAYGESATLSWNSSGADTCVAFGGWSGDQPTSGSQDTGSLLQNTTYSLVCSGPGGADAATVTALVALAPAPLINFTAADPDIGYGEATTLDWSVTNADSCVAGGSWTGDRADSGSEPTGALYRTSAYVLNCVGPGGARSKTVTVTVAEAANLPLTTFESAATGSDPQDWFDTDVGYSVNENDALFEVVRVDGNKALGTPVFDGANAHSHYVGVGSADWRNYRYTGRMRLDNTDGQIGVTVFSGYPQEDTYYRLSYSGDQGSYRISSRGQGVSCADTPDTGVQPQAGVWYRFMIEADDRGSRTDLRAKVWPEGDAEPDWQALCSDYGTRRLAGTVGVWTSMVDDLEGRYWDDLAVSPIDQPVNPPPIVTLLAEPVVVGNGNSATLIWSAENADSCMASGGWTGSRVTAGVEVVGPLEVDTTFVLTCNGPGGSYSASASVSVTDIVPMTLTFSGDTDVVGFGGSVTLTWEAENAQVCVTSGGWSGTRPTSGMEVVDNITADTSFLLKCYSTSGFIAETVSVTVDQAAGPPLISFVADVRTLALDNNNVLLLWETLGASSCTASGEWSGSKPVVGQETVGPIVTEHEYVLTCSGPGGTSSELVMLSFVDDDEDGLADVWELATFGNLNSDGSEDSDSDGLLDRDEYLLGTSPLFQDTDGDGENDYEESLYGSDPLDIGSNWHAHRPLQPVVAVLNNAPLWGAELQISGDYVDPDGDALGYAEWQLADNADFDRMAIDRDVAGRAEAVLPAGVLSPSTKYYARTRHWDDTGVPSEWSQTRSFQSADSYPNDSDGNGIDDDDQVNGFADSNGNGVDDGQEGICNLYDAEGNSIVGLSSADGTIQCFRSVGAADVPADEWPDSDLPYGMFSFRVTGLPVNPDNPATADVTIYLPAALDPDTGWFKYDPAVGASVDFSQHATVNGNSVRLRLTDGGAGDQDGIVNGMIIDPSGPTPPAGSVTPPAPAPTPPPAGGGGSTTPPSGGGDGGGGGGGAAGWVSLALMGLYALRRRRLIHRQRQ